MTTDHNYGCHNSKREDGYYAQQGWLVYSEPPHDTKLRIPVAEYITDTMSKACQYRVHKDDPKCAGCSK